MVNTKTGNASAKRFNPFTRTTLLVDFCLVSFISIGVDGKANTSVFL